MTNTRLKERNRGFTLVETLVAIMVLVAAIAGPLYAVHRSLIASYTARDTLAATALAQEGMEYVRSVRDGNYLSGNSNWLQGLDLCAAATGCAVDPNATSLSSQIQAYATSSAALSLDTSYRYRLGTGTPTRFIRKVTVTTVSATEVEVTTTVFWTTIRVPYTVTVREHLYNWQ